MNNLYCTLGPNIIKENPILDFVLIVRSSFTLKLNPVRKFRSDLFPIFLTSLYRFFGVRTLA